MLQDSIPQQHTVEVSFPIPFYTQQVDFEEEFLQGFNSREEAEYWQASLLAVI